MNCKTIWEKVKKLLGMTPNETTVVGVNPPVEEQITELKSLFMEELLASEPSPLAEALRITATRENSQPYSSEMTVKSRRGYMYNNLSIYKFVERLYYRTYITYFNKQLIIFNKNPRLPLDGWFQSCFSCDTITGQLHRCDNYERPNLFVRMCQACSEDYRSHPKSKDSILLTEDLNDAVTIMESLGL